MKKNNIKDEIGGMLSDIVKEVISTSVKSPSEGKNRGRKHKPVDVVFPSDSKVRSVDIGKIRKYSTNTYKPDDEIENWTCRDFALYFIDIYKSKIDSSFSCGIIGLTIYFQRIFDAINNQLGYCDNVVAKNYINFLIENKIPFLLMQHSNRFYIGWLKQEDIISDFVSVFNYSKALGVDGNNDGVVIEESFSAKSLSEKLHDSLRLGFDNLFLEYGFIGPVNWLVNSGKMTEDAAIDAVCKSLARFNKKIEMKKALKSTNENGPYPEWFTIKSFDVLLNGLNKKYFIKTKIDLEISISSDSLWDTIRRQSLK